MTSRQSKVGTEHQQMHIRSGGPIMQTNIHNARVLEYVVKNVCYVGTKREHQTCISTFMHIYVYRLGLVILSHLHE